MQRLTILNSREARKIKEKINQQFGYSLQEDYAYLQNEKNKIFLVNKDLEKIDTSKLIIDRIGLYFAELKDERVRLSKEGAQLLAWEAKKNKKNLKNCVELTVDEVKEYFQGLDINKNLGAENRLVILTYKDDTLGCAQYKDKKILNFLPKIHRGEVIL